MNDTDQPAPPSAATPAAATPPAEPSAATTMVLATDLLPDELLIVPGTSKPVFPGMAFPAIFPPGPLATLLATLGKGAARDKHVGFVLAREALPEGPLEGVIKHLYPVGTAARILNLQESDDQSVRVIFQGVKRFRLGRLYVRQELLYGQVDYLKEPDAPATEQVKALALGILSTIRELVKNNPMFSEEIKLFLSRATLDNPARLADFSASVTNATPEELQEILETLDIPTRLEKVLILLRKELDINQLKERITHQIEEKLSKQQRDFFLREQLKAIKTELGLEKDDKSSEVDKLKERLAKLTLTPEAQQRVDDELNKLKLLPQESPEFAVSRNYLDWLTSLPWGIMSEDHLDIARAREVLDRDHDGLEDVKARILEFIGVAKLRGTVSGSILCLIGPPGVGKTSLGRAIAASLGRKFYRFSLGGMRDEAEIKGHRRTYIGALPGKFIQTMRYTGTQNPVIMLDEIDKIGASYQGDPASALLEVLDPEQNNSFLDHFLDVRFDLSKVLFIATANVQDTIPAPLLDRMEVIRLSGYILPEKLAIARHHLIPRQVPEHGLSKADIRFTDSGLKTLIHGYAREAGVRGLEKAIRGCLRKVAARKAEGTLKAQVVVDAKTVEELLGRPTFPDEQLLKEHHPGVVTGLAWTALGGNVLFIEAVAIPGTPGLKLTGQLGDVMKESATIAYSLLHGNLQRYGLPEDYCNKVSVHLHVPAGATPKDGPSAGVTMATALISMASKRPVPAHLAMTGELTLTGAVLPVGGIKEKMIAARRTGVRDVILPAANERDFTDIPALVRQGLTPHYVTHYQEVYDLVFGGGLGRGRRERLAQRGSKMKGDVHVTTSGKTGKRRRG